ncbi:MAG: DUF262 domain-containing HNH endonuclease family protein [Thiothrix sp.]|uniref:DUF262 domain-containing HNH endonuclease family protein n=1 Tax=Thiothrix sp. TaxID=1032 RepID=UPI00261D059E|nr:DUF262 domain-containing HNH endonuclease family protein [Thiothrix sp.]MDD5391704.1 DUF262 domain-containing HNH endonuclease family protein [Thiothrix sp.]
MDIKDVFSAQPKSVWEYLCEPGLGLYIPAYQRHYSWDKNKISRLMEDACHGFSMLVERADAITFIGTIIAIHDTGLSTVEPAVKGEVPAKVMTIIDGQQRLSTILLINTVLHEEIKLAANKLNKEDDAQYWLYEECIKVVTRLGKTFEEDTNLGDDLFKFYPRMIRAYVDSWSRRQKTASYISPVGYYLHEYGNYSRNNNNNRFKYLAPIASAEQVKYDLLKNARLSIQKIIKIIAKNTKSDEKLEIPKFESIIKSTNFQNTLLNAEIPEAAQKILESESDKSYEELLRIVFFANFVLDRIAITIVTAKNEDYAFDMFESLNTTGEPLTAFETFKPRVVYSEKLSEYKNTPSYNYIEQIENYLESFSESKDKQDATSRLIISFELAERGKGLSKRLSEQRRFLKDSYEEIDCIDSNERRNFLRHLSHSAIFMKKVWTGDKKEKPDLSPISDDKTSLCVDFLKKLNHTITIGILARYYSEVLSSTSECRNEAISEFISVTKAVTAFSILWRSSRKTTEGIDSIYRELMYSGYENTNNGVILKPLARCRNSCDLPKSHLLKKALVDKLKENGGIICKEEWIKKILRIPIYSTKGIVARFLLLASAHDNVVDKENPGLTIIGKQGVLPLFNLRTWDDESSQTVEHIAPQTKNEGWLDSIYEDPDTINKLGNLTLLPPSENSSLGNGSWQKKKLFYKVLSADTLDDLNQLLAKAKLDGVNISGLTEKLLENSSHLPMVKSVANVDGDWTKEIIESRTVRIADLAWQRIAPWLDIEV